MQNREKLHELLASAGLTVVEDVRPGSLFPPEAGWRIARGIAAPHGACPLSPDRQGRGMERSGADRRDWVKRRLTKFKELNRYYISLFDV